MSESKLSSSQRQLKKIFVVQRHVMSMFEKTQTAKLLLLLSGDLTIIFGSGTAAAQRIEMNARPGFKSRPMMSDRCSYCRAYFV